MRIVTLTCSNTEIVCALDCAHMIVACDNHSDFPSHVVRALPRMGPDLNIDIDRVASMKPDLVLASLTVPGHEKIVEGLEAAGLNYLAPEPLSLVDVHADIRLIAEALDVVERGECLIEDMKSAMLPVVSEKEKPSILVQWWPKPVIAAGEKSWVHDMIEAAGGVNALAGRDVKSMPLTFQELSMLDPDAIVISWCGVQRAKYRPDVIYENPALASIAALKKKHVYCISEEFMGRPSPRLVNGFLALKEIVQGI